MALAAQDAHRDAGIVDVALAGDQIAMPGIAFSGGKSALGVHHADVEEFRHRDPLDQRALRATAFPARARRSAPPRRRVRRAPRVVGTASRMPLIGRGCRATTGSSASTASSTAQQPTRARQRPKTVERERQRHAALERHPPLRRLEADDAVIGRRNPARSAGVGAERAMRHAGRRRIPPRPTTIRRARDRRSRCQVPFGVPKCGLMPIPE